MEIFAHSRRINFETDWFLIFSHHQRRIVHQTCYSFGQYFGSFCFVLVTILFNGSAPEYSLDADVSLEIYLRRDGLLDL